MATSHAVIGLFLVELLVLLKIENSISTFMCSKLLEKCQYDFESLFLLVIHGLF
jgi:hypothetical protein